MSGIKRRSIFAIIIIALIVAGQILPAAVIAEGSINNPPYFTYPEYTQAFEINEGEGLPNLQAEDPDGDTLTFAITFGSLPPGISMNVDGSFNGTAGNPTQDAYYIDVEVSDGKGGTDTAGIMITVHPINDTPEFTGAESNTSQVILVGQGLANIEAYDQDGDTLTFTITSGTLPGGISMNDDGSFTGTADTDSAGDYTVGINVNDGNMGVDDTTLNIIVNRLPSFTEAASNTSQTIEEGQGLTALEAIDPDSDLLSFSLIDGALPDGISLNADGSFSGVATFFSAGAYSSTIVVEDVYKPVIQTVLSINVKDVNRYPVFTNAAANTRQSILVGLGLTALTAADLDNDAMTYSLISGVLPGNITLNADGSFSGTAETSSTGSYTIIIDVSDSKGGTAQTTLAVSVTRPSDRDDDDDSGDNNTGNTANNNNDSYAVPPVIPSQTQGAIFNDIQSIGSNKPVMQIQEELQLAGIKDVKATDWFSGPVTVIVQSGLLKPSEDGMFHPEADVSLAEGIAVFAKVIGIAAKDDTPSEAVAKMQEAGLLGDNMDTSRGMSRLDVAKLLGKALGVEPAVVTSRDQYPFADFDEITPEERGIVKAMYDLGIIKGYFEDGIRTFRPDTILTRAQLAILVDRILGAH